MPFHILPLFLNDAFNIHIHNSMCKVFLVFIAKDTAYKPGQESRSKLCTYRLKGNYLRFYPKYIEPVSEKIRQGPYKDQSPKRLSIRPVLIYCGELKQGISEEDYFDKIMCFEDLLTIR